MDIAYKSSHNDITQQTCYMLLPDLACCQNINGATACLLNISVSGLPISECPSYLFTDIQNGIVIVFLDFFNNILLCRHFKFCKYHLGGQRLIPQGQRS